MVVGNATKSPINIMELPEEMVCVFDRYLYISGAALRDNEGEKDGVSMKKRGSRLQYRKGWQGMARKLRKIIKKASSYRGEADAMGDIPECGLKERGILREAGEISKDLKKEPIPTQGKVAEKRN